MAERAVVAIGAVAGTGLGVANAISVGGLSKRVDAIEVALTKLGVNPGQMTGIIETFQANISQLQASVAQLQTDDARDATRLAVLESQVANLLQRVAALERS